MSLDFYLYRKPAPHPCTCQCGHQHMAEHEDEVASFNITHNLSNMAGAAGIYKCLWRPEEHVPPITTAGQCIPILCGGLDALMGDPQRFRQYSAANGWGTYEQFVPWVADVLVACINNPDALVRASR